MLQSVVSRAEVSLAKMAEKQRRKLWSEESMREAVASVRNGNPLRKASREYNVPVETLRRRVSGAVTEDCRPGPSTVLTKDEEECLAKYVIEMADRGFGLSSEDLMRTAFSIVAKSGRVHPFHDGMAGRGWLEAFRRRHPEISLRTPQSLSYSRASAGSKEVIDDFFAKLGALYGRLNLIAKPMQVYNIDETGITVVHKPGKVYSAVGRKHVYSLASGEKGKTHTVVVCVSASGHSIPPLMIYPRKRAVPEAAKAGAVPGTIFKTSDSGWITQEIYLEWFKFFLQMIPPARPVLLIEDGHSSHVTLEVIELARSNDVHLLCLPSHTSHILQPLDIGVFKSFKCAYSKACKKFIRDNPGRVITSEVIASLVGDTWAQSVTPMNILSGFKKSGISPFNLSEVSDRMLAPAKVFAPSEEGAKIVAGANILGDAVDEAVATASSTASLTFSDEQIVLFETRYSEGYDLHDPVYELWLKETHPGSSDADSMTTHISQSVSTVSSGELSDILKYPESNATTKKKKSAFNSTAVCLSDSPIVHQLKEKEQQKKQLEQERVRKRECRERKKQECELKKAAKEKRIKGRRNNEEKGTRALTRRAKKLVADVADKYESNSTTEDDEAECPVCHVPGLSCQWICCDSCNVWYHTHCTDADPDNLPDLFNCLKCV